MPGYRFCRTDDLPLLAAAYNVCTADHVAGAPRLSVDDLKAAAREHDLWASSCMVAFAGEAPIAVLLGGKRPTENRIQWIGVHPDHRRQGHGRHLVTSLRDKLAILGPPRLVAEAPEEDAPARAFLEAAGFTADRSLADFEIPTPAEAPSLPEAAVSAVSVDELVELGALSPEEPRAWARSLDRLRRRGTEAYAVATDLALEAWVAARGEEILGLGGGPLLGALLGWYGARIGSALSVPAASEQEAGVLAALGLAACRRSVGYVIVASS